MASRILSRFLPGAESNLYDVPMDNKNMHRSLEAGQHTSDEPDFHDYVDEHELDNMLLEAGDQSIANAESTNLITRAPDPISGRQADRHHTQPSKQRWTPGHRSGPHEEEEEVPDWLLMDTKRDQTRQSRLDMLPAPPSVSHTEAQWKTAQKQQRLHHEDRGPPYPPAQGPSALSRRVNIRVDAKEQALWRWLNTTNVDGFLLEVYQYYSDHGIWSILLSRAIYVLTTVFLFSMYMFMSTCVDFAKIPHSKSTSEVLIPQCMKKTSFLKNVMLWVFVFWWFSTVFRYIADIRRLWHIHEFFDALLEIPETDLQAIPWERVVERLMSLRNANPETAEVLPSFLNRSKVQRQSKQRMDAHDIANRLMRRDNYYIAMINKEILDLSLPVPFLGSRQFYSKSLEYCLGSCFENFIFDDHGHVQKTCLDPKNRNRMIEALRRRLRFAAIISIFMAPFNIGAHCVYYFSRYYAVSLIILGSVSPADMDPGVQK